MTGISCPRWCSGEHAVPGLHRGAVSSVVTPSGGELAAYPVSWGNGARVSVAAYDDGPSGLVHAASAGDCAGLANMLDALASATPGSIRELAGQVREASAQAFAEPEAGS